jgi:AcrR family transcriptional regulator
VSPDTSPEAAREVSPRPVETLTARGLRTRAALLDAARVVFARSGFAESRIADISRVAGVAHGTFYTYFSSKEEVLHAVMSELQREMASERPAHTAPPSPAQGIEAAHRHYLRMYRTNAALLATLEQVATLSEDLRTMRREHRRFFVDRTARAIQRWQDAGLADPGLDPTYTASALGNMVDRFAYVWFVIGEEFDEDKAVETLTRLWVQALGLDHEHPPSPHRRPRLPGRSTSTS